MNVSLRAMRPMRSHSYGDRLPSAGRTTSACAAAAAAAARCTGSAARARAPVDRSMPCAPAGRSARLSSILFRSVASSTSILVRFTTSGSCAPTSPWPASGDPAMSPIVPPAAPGSDESEPSASPGVAVSETPGPEGVANAAAARAPAAAAPIPEGLPVPPAPPDPWEQATAGDTRDTNTMTRSTRAGKRTRPDQDATTHQPATP